MMDIRVFGNKAKQLKDGDILKVRKTSVEVGVIE